MEFEEHIPHDDGVHVYVSVKFPIRTEDGEIAAVYGISTDVTEYKRMAAQLHQSEKMDAISQLAGGIAHDFNNQLTAIMGYSSMLYSHLEDEELISFADTILKASKHAKNLTTQLLAFSRKGKYLSVPVDTHRTIAEVVALLEPSIDGRLRVRQLLAASPSMTTGDPTQLQNVLLNLGLNALDAMPDGGELVLATDTVTLDEAFCRESEFDITPGKYLQIKVADTGTGMDEETLNHIFEPFFSTKREDEGTGMGLAAVYGTMVHHHGAVVVESEAGHGSTFTLYLPLSEAVEPEGKGAARKAAPAKGTARILVVEDEEIVRKVAEDILRDVGYKVVTCEDGAEALEYYRKSWKQIDLVFLDIVMPRLSGLDAFLAMKAINPDIRALLSSGYRLSARAAEILSTGVLDVVQKPYRVEDLCEKVASALQK